MSEIVDVVLLKFNKFRVYLDCGHDILYDCTVDSSDEYTENIELICNECKENYYEC